MKRSRAGEPLRFGDTVLIPVHQVVVRHVTAKGNVFIQVDVEPTGIVVHTSGGDRAIDCQGRDIPLETLTDRNEELQAILEKLRTTAPSTDT